MGDASESSLKAALPTLRWLTPGTEEYRESRFTYCASNPAVPQAILCPRSAEEVAAIVRQAREHNIPFSVRSGGHDLQGRCMVHDALCIDMRDINFINVASDRKTAVIGGGVLFGKLTTELHSQGLVTPNGSVPAIGYVGWASLGGYGCYSSNFGLGVDQIMEVEIVNDHGDIITADKEMLTGIRGAGGNFGIITSLRIKVYEVKTLLAGMVLFDTSNGISKVFKDVLLHLQDLDFNGDIPRELVLQPLVVNHPEAGRSFGVTYIWSSDDLQKGRECLDGLLEQLPAKVAMNTVTEMTPPAWIYMLDTFIAKCAWGPGQGISFNRLSPRVLDIIGHSLEDMPSDPCTCFSLHILGSKSPSVTNSAFAEASCFNPEARKPHTMIEIVGSASSEDGVEVCGRWARTMYDALLASGEAMKSTYVSLAGPGAFTLEEIYGEKYGLLKLLKQKYDPDGVFKYAVPRLLD